MYKLWCEWDFDQDSFIFDSKQAAFTWLANDDNFKEMIEGTEDTIDTYIADGLVGTEFLEIRR